MPMSRGLVSIADSGIGVETKSGLAGRLYDLLKANVDEALAAGGNGTLDAMAGDPPPDPKPSKRVLAAQANDQAEFLTPGTFDVGTVSGAVSLNFTNGNSQKMTLNGNATLSFVNVQDAATIQLHIIQDGTGSRLVTWPGTARFRNGTTDSTVSVAANAHDLYVGCVSGADVYFLFPSKNLV